MAVEKRLTLSNDGNPRLLRWFSVIAWVLVAVIFVACSGSSTPAVISSPAPTATTQLEGTMLPPGAQGKTLVSGSVIDGGDMTPGGLLDAPRNFTFKVEREDGSFVFVAYTAYPPSPVGTREAQKINLDFHAGEVLIGDYLEAQGSYDQSANTLTVEEEGDYIKTYPEKPQ